jgi:Uma2 family endonuclease
MPSQIQIGVEEYFSTSFEDEDFEYVDGELLERNVGDIDHATLQTFTAAWFASRRGELNLFPLVAVRTQVSPTRFRVPDLIVVRGSKPPGRIVTKPPFLIVEVLSPEDRVSRMEQKIDDYIRFGVAYIWVIDPVTSTGHIYTGGRRILVEDGIFRAENPEIEIDLNTL